MSQLRNQKENKNLPETNININTVFQNVWDVIKAVHSNTSLLQKTRKISNKQSNFTSKETKKDQTKLKVSKRRDII